MKVVICGAGQVGFNIAQYLSAQGNDVTVVDQSSELLGRISEQMDVRTIVGHAAYPDILETAGVNDADMLIAVTMIDEVNMTACQVAHALFGVPKKIARIRQQNYLAPAWRDLFTSGNIAIDVIISPEMEVARTIARRLEIAGAFDSISMAGDCARVIGVRCTESTPLINTPLRQLTSLFPDLNIMLLAILRGETVIIPGASDQMLPGDDVYFVVSREHIARALAAFGREDRQTRRVVIVGGGNIGVALGRELSGSGNGYSLRMIEQSEQRARMMAAEFADMSVLCGSGLDRELLEEGNIREAETIVAVTDHDETNILSCLLAKRLGAQHAMALVNSPGYGPLISNLGVDVLISPREITVSGILQHIRRGMIRAVHSLRDGVAEIMEAEILHTSPLAGMTIGAAGLPKGMLIGMIVRDGGVIIPRSDTQIREKDRLILIAAADSVGKVEKMLAVRPEYF